MFQDNAAQCVDLAIKYRLRAVSYGRGPDKQTIARFEAAKVLCIPTVGALKHALKAVELGADMITIQGGEGGGHTGGVPSSIRLLPQVRGGGQGTGDRGRRIRHRPWPGLGARCRWCRHRHGHAVPHDPQIADTGGLERYLKVNDPQLVRVTTAVDGMRHRMIENRFINHLEQAGPFGRLRIALGSAWQWKQQTGMSLGHMAAVFLRALREDPSQLSQVVMAANQPVLLQRSMVDGAPDEGILPSGQVAAAW